VHLVGPGLRHSETRNQLTNRVVAKAPPRGLWRVTVICTQRALPKQRVDTHATVIHLNFDGLVGRIAKIEGLAPACVQLVGPGLRHSKRIAKVEIRSRCSSFTERSDCEGLGDLPRDSRSSDVGPRAVETAALSLTVSCG
jgi:hypothetical protein